MLNTRTTSRAEGRIEKAKPSIAARGNFVGEQWNTGFDTVMVMLLVVLHIEAELLRFR